MKNNKMTAILGVTIILLIMTGCSPKYLKQEDISNIKRIAVVTSLTNKELKVLDHTNVSGSITAATGGGLIPALIEAGIASKKIKSSLGGDPVPLRQKLADFPIKQIFDKNFVEIFSINFELVTPQEIDKLKIEEYSKIQDTANRTIKNYAILNEKFGVDTVLEINFSYGLAAYAKINASTVISGDVSVINVMENKLLMKKIISSDDYYKNSHTVDEFEQDEAKLFKKEILEAIQGFSHLVASEFGVAIQEKDKSYWQQEKK